MNEKLGKNDAWHQVLKASDLANETNWINKLLLNAYDHEL